MIVEIERLDDFGRGICFINNKICFVENALIGEKVEIEIILEKSKYLVGRVIKYISKSKDRVKVDCPYYDICGGCSLLHLKYEEENKYKLDKVKNKLKKFAGIEIDLDIKYRDQYNYRNKVVLHVKDNKLGFYNDNSNDLVEIDKCLLCSDKINDIISKIKEFDNSNIKEIMIRVSNDNKSSIISIYGDNYDDKYLDICDVFVFNDEIVTDNKYIYTNIDNVKYRLGYNSFFQINRYLTSDMYSYIKEFVLNKSINNIIDLYCGVGSIGIYVCNNSNINLIGIDNNESNIEDGVFNSKENKCLAKYYVGDASEFMKYDGELIIIDPARSGLNKDTINNLITYKSKYIIYVSCNDSTLARDLNVLKDYYNIIDMKVFNNFPRTYHCESITVLERK